MDTRAILVPKPTLKPFERHILVCVKGRCAETGNAETLFDVLRDKLTAAGLDAGERRVGRLAINPAPFGSFAGRNRFGQCN